MKLNWTGCVGAGLIIGLCVGAAGVTPALGDELPRWTCEPSEWDGAPGMQQGWFVGTQKGHCSLELAHDGDLALLDRHFLDDVSQSKQVHAGPIEESVAGLPGVRYDVTVEYTEGTYMTLRQDVRIGTDSANRLIYATTSQSIRASGMAGYLRRLDVSVEVTRGSNPRHVDVVLTNTIAVDRPWYAPTGIFVGKAKETAISQFRKVRDQMMAGVAANL